MNGTDSKKSIKTNYSFVGNCIGQLKLMKMNSFLLNLILKKKPKKKPECCKYIFRS